MDTRQLKYFIAVIDHRGFSRAAEHLRIAQPSLSQAIAGFERELGMPLFHRVGRRGRGNLRAAPNLCPGTVKCRLIPRPGVRVTTGPLWRPT